MGTVALEYFVKGSLVVSDGSGHEKAVGVVVTAFDVVFVSSIDFVGDKKDVLVEVVVVVLIAVVLVVVVIIVVIRSPFLVMVVSEDFAVVVAAEKEVMMIGVESIAEVVDIFCVVFKFLFEAGVTLILGLVDDSTDVMFFVFVPVLVVCSNDDSIVFDIMLFLARDEVKLIPP